MKKKVRTLIQRISHDPLHAIIGGDLIATGLILLFHQQYFFWPPYPKWITVIENDSIVGFVGLVTGTGLIWWALQHDKSIRLNRLCLSASSAYYALLSATELMHGLLSPMGEPHMLTTSFSEIALLLVTLYMAKKSPTKRDEYER